MDKGRLKKAARMLVRLAPVLLTLFAKNVAEIDLIADRSRRLSKGRYTLDIFARDIAIKRYCDKKILR